MDIRTLKKNDINSELQAQVSTLYRQLNADITQLHLNTILADGRTLLVVALDGEILVGMAMMARYKVLSGYKGMIEDVVVSSEYRGRGIGRALMEKLLEHAKGNGLNDVLLFSGHHRTAAISLYKSLGFTLKESGLYVKNI